MIKGFKFFYQLSLIFNHLSVRVMPEEKIIGVEGSEELRGNVSEKPINHDGKLEIYPSQEGDVMVERGGENAEGKYHEILSKVVPQAVATTQTDDNEVSLDAKSIGATIDEDSKVQKLLDLASAKGVVYAVKVARSLEDYYALDRMHDELVDKLYAGLLEKGLIQID
jgi:hypothetical protein